MHHYHDYVLLREPIILLLHSQSSWKSRRGFPQIKHVTLTLCVTFGSADSKELRFLSKSDILSYVDINEKFVFWGEIIDSRSILHAETYVQENDLWNIKLNELLTFRHLSCMSLHMDTVTPKLQLL